MPLGESSCRGFSLADKNAPAIAVNTAWRTEARIFTLFHEYGHLLTRTESACLEVGFNKGLSEIDDDTERWCERFSAAVLMPKQAVLAAFREANAKESSLPLATSLANRFRVSLRAAVIRLVELQLATWDLYRVIPPSSDWKRPGGGGMGRSRLKVREDQYGYRTTRLLYKAVDRELLSRTDVLGILNIGDSDFDRIQTGTGE
jgi:Zn-dependent peptidase ImmA (M78 family)